MAGLNKVQAWQTLTPEARDALDAYLEHRQRKFFVGGVSTLLAILALLGSFLAWALTDLRDRAELEATVAAEKKFDVLFEEKYKPQLKLLGDQIKELENGSRTAFDDVRRAELISKKAAEDIEKWTSRAEKDIEKWTSQAERMLGEVEGIEKIVTLSLTLADIREEIHRNREDLDVLRLPVATTPQDPLSVEEFLGQPNPDDDSTAADEQ